MYQFWSCFQCANVWILWCRVLQFCFIKIEFEKTWWRFIEVRMCMWDIGQCLKTLGSLFSVSDDIRVVNAFDFKYAQANSSTSFWSTQFVFYLIKAYHMLHFHVKCFMSELLMNFIRLTHDSEREATRDQKSRRQKTKGSVIRHQSLEELWWKSLIRYSFHKIK